MLVSEHIGLEGIGNEKRDYIWALWRQANRYHYASLQDRDPVVAMRHNGYAVALIDALRDLAGEEEIKTVTGESAQKKRQEIIAVQDRMETVALTLLNELKKKGLSLNF